MEANTDYMQDTMGRLVPVELVKEIDKTRDILVRELVAQAIALSTCLADYKAAAMGDIEAFIELSAERYGIRIGGTKGNVSLMSYDGQYKILRAIEEYTVFDERLQVAKSLVDECIHKWSQGSRAEIRALINDAFQVDKAGRVNTKRILGLRRLNIEDETWQQAMTAIAESLQTVGSKAYLRIYKRQDDGSYKQLSLDVAA